MTLSIFFHLQPSCPSGSASVLARNLETPTLPMMYVPNHSISFQFDPNNSLLFRSNPKKFHLITGWGWWCRACPCWWLRRGRGRRRGRGNFFVKTNKNKILFGLVLKNSLSRFGFEKFVKSQLLYGSWGSTWIWIFSLKCKKIWEKISAILSLKIFRWWLWNLLILPTYNLHSNVSFIVSSGD